MNNDNNNPTLTADGLLAKDDASFLLPFIMITSCFAYFVMTCGLSLLETSCNPFIYCMGSEETATGRLGLYCLVLVSGCMSLMFPTIYGIALRGLGDNVKIGGAGLIMSILGGSVFPPLQAVVIDSGVSIGQIPSTNLSFILTFVCFVVVAVYGHRAYIRHKNAANF